MTDFSIKAAASALAAGDPLRALDRVALRDDASSLALRGIAMAQLGELGRARTLLRDAATKFGMAEPLARARCIVASTEVDLALRELGTTTVALRDAVAVLDEHGDRDNALHARLLEIRWALLLGRVDEAERGRAQLELDGASPMLRAIAELVAADTEIRRVRPATAAAALDEAWLQASRTRIGALVTEIELARERLRQPAARRSVDGRLEALRLDEVAELLGSGAFVVDGCRRAVVRKGLLCSLVRRPVVFGLVIALAKAWPSDAAREDLLARVFEASSNNASWRGRLRVEVGRLRKVLGELGTVVATARGYRLEPGDADEVTILAPPVDGDNAAVFALLADGAPWSTSALALALGVSQRTVQRAIAALEAEGRVEGFGRGRARRWVAQPVSGYTTALLLPAVGS